VGNDLLDGGQGRDIMFGGAGDDTYRVDDPGDIVSEQTNQGVDDGGVDYVQSKVSYTLVEFIES
jgi:Ca2+-binding RTX toxin-like protein